MVYLFNLDEKRYFPTMLSPVDAAITEKDENNIFEGTVLANDVITQGQTELYVIIACGDSDNFSTRHIFRKSLLVKLK